MEKNNTEMANIELYGSAVQAIKSAILQGQLEAAKSVNRTQLVIYFAIGRYISNHTRKDAWGTHALEFISERLRKELPGLRGFSERSLKNMRMFYESWIVLDPNSAIAIAELKSPTELVDIQHVMSITNAIDFPIEDFFRVPFTHHIRIIEGVDNLQARYYYIHRTAEEYLSVERLKKLMLEKAHEHQNDMPNNFVNTIPDGKEARKALTMFKDEYMLDFINVEEIGERDNMDVDERVPEPLRKALPDVQKMMEIISTNNPIHHEHH